MTPGRGYTPARLPAQFHDLLLPGSQLFNEDLYFGKLSWQLGDAHLVELTAKRRNEVAEISAGGSNSFEHGTDRKNTDDRAASSAASCAGSVPGGAIRCSTGCCDFTIAGPRSPGNGSPSMGGAAFGTGGSAA